MTLMLTDVNTATIAQNAKSRRAAIYMTLLLFLFSTAFSFATGEDQRNYLVIGIMGMSFLLFPFTFGKFYSGELYVYLFCLSLTMCLMQSPESFRKSTFAYTLMFALTFVVYMRMLHRRKLPLRSYKKLLKFTLYAYFIILLIQQFCLITGLPIFNLILSKSAEFKLNALSPEPSHSARIITILFYSFICMRERELQRSYRLFSDGFTDLRDWFCFLYVMMTMGSGTAYFLLALLLIRFVSIPTLFWGTGLAALIFIFSPFLRLYIIPLDRVMAVSIALLTGSPEKIAYIDHSASIRILPIYYYLEQVRLFSASFWFGAGFDYNLNLFPKLIPGIPDSVSIGGLFPALFLNHGMVAGILLIVMIYKNCLSKLLSFTTLLGAVLIFACGINSQISWLVLMLLATNQYFEHSKPEFRRR